MFQSPLNFLFDSFPSPDVHGFVHATWLCVFPCEEILGLCAATVCLLEDNIFVPGLVVAVLDLCSKRIETASVMNILKYLSIYKPNFLLLTLLKQNFLILQLISLEMLHFSGSPFSFQNFLFVLLPPKSDFCDGFKLVKLL